VGSSAGMILFGSAKMNAEEEFQYAGAAVRRLPEKTLAV